MPVITLFSASHCHGEVVANKVADRLDYVYLTDKNLLDETAKQFDVANEKLQRSMYGHRPLLNRFTHLRERNIAFLRSTLAETIRDDGVVYHGLASHLLPMTLTHVLRVCLVAKFDYRVMLASEAKGLSPKGARKILRKEDVIRKQWTHDLSRLNPWDTNLYDILLSMDSTSVEESIEAICDNAAKPQIQTTPASQKAMNDFILACRIYLELAKQGHEVEVSCQNGVATMIINRYVMRLERLKRELNRIAMTITGVKSVKTKIGQRCILPSMYPKLDLPSKILLVDDEKEFVNTLSERLQARNLESVVAYNGEDALSIVKTDTPDVMVLDLKMPGIDGMEVLRRVKREYPATEVIILTGHGSEKEEELAYELGAFAYLNKPVDIDILADAMREAYRRINQAKKDQEG